MKKAVCLFFVLIMISLLFSCDIGENTMKNHNQKISNQKLEEILDAIQAKDKNKIISSFSPEAIKKTDNFELSINALFDYFYGTVESYNDWGGPITETTKENGEILQILDSTYDIRTTKSEYRFTIQYVVKDTANKDNIGIHSLYIIKTAEDVTSQNAYWGDGKHTPGINIGIKNADLN